jgi:dihydrofolate synthase/folylpolyglutamate synthase
MNFAEAIEHLYGLAPELAPPKDPTAPRRKFDLAHMRRLCAALGDPQNQVPSVLIAGTNGKGSTASTLANILSAAGYRTGLYTSPHLTRVNERIQLSHPVLPGEYGASVAAGASPGADGPLVFSEIPDDRFAARYTQVEATANRLVESGGLPFPPSFFERLTAIAFLFFADSHAEIMILEVGLGGRLDATNVVNPLLSVITDIALDHQDYLGNTIAEIAAEKCGILRPAGTLITLPQLPEANHAIGIAASAMEVRAINAAPRSAQPTPQSAGRRPAVWHRPPERHTIAAIRQKLSSPPGRMPLSPCNSPAIVTPSRWRTVLPSISTPRSPAGTSSAISLSPSPPSSNSGSRRPPS